MNRRTKIIVSVAGIFIVLLALLGLTYAYFLTKINGNTNNKSISVTTANLKLDYGDGNGTITGANIMPGTTLTSKTFSVKNNGNVNMEYRIYLVDVVNTFVRKDDLKYTLNCTTNGTISCNKVITETTFPSGINSLVTNTIEPNKTHTYTLTISYKNLEENQSVDMGKELSAKIQLYTKDNNNEYFPYEKETLAYTIINNVKNGSLSNKTEFTPNLNASGMIDNVTTASDKILSTAEDDGGTTYYFRGNPIDNYVQFAGMCWRIVRIQGDGSTKLILASELPCSSSNLTDDSGYATDGGIGVKSTKLSAMYGRKASADGYFNYNDYINSPYNNSARTKLNTWLNTKITVSKQTLLKNDTWCIGDQINGYSPSKTGKIIGNISDLLNSGTKFYYSARNRFEVTKTPTYKCDATGDEGEVDVNKIGMLTMDEVVYAGGGNKSNLNYYLNNNVNNSATNYWWILSPSDYMGDAYDIAFNVDYNGHVAPHYGRGDSMFALRPVVTLSYTVKYASGDGTINNPYKIVED